MWNFLKQSTSKIHYTTILLKKLNLGNKYIKLKNNNKWKEYFPIFPSIIVISNKPEDTNKDLNIITMDLDLNNFNNIKG